MKTVALCAVLTGTLLAAEPKPREWTVDGVKREGLVALPEKTDNPVPVVFAFHGHGGTAKFASRWNYHTLWPEAAVVYLQGLKTPSPLVDLEGKLPGWQLTAGTHNDRDVKLFDTVLAGLDKEITVDNKRIYCTGHSNGGAFTYLLWSERGDTFAAVAPAAAVANTRTYKLKLKPVLALGGEKDTLVKFEWQKAGFEAMKKVNGCEADGKAWPHDKRGTVYSSKDGPPLITWIHPGAHEFPKEAPALIVKFFKDHPKP